MDFLKQEIERKQTAMIASSQGKKYIRGGDLKRRQAESYLQAQVLSKKSKTIKFVNSIVPSNCSTVEDVYEAPAVEIMAKSDPKKVREQLRARGEPAMIFGEDPEDTLFRFESLADPVAASNEMDQQLENAKDITKITPKFLRAERKECQLLVITYFRRLSGKWKQSLAEKTRAELSTPEGRKLNLTFEQTLTHLEPLYKLLRRMKLSEDKLLRVVEIAWGMHRKEYMYCLDAYQRLAIGNAPWPIGVTSVIAHERCGDDKISQNHVAGVLNDEVQRKWIQGIKRLMTFCQSISPNEDFAKNVG